MSLAPWDADVWVSRARIFAMLGRKDRMAADLAKASGKWNPSTRRQWVPKPARIFGARSVQPRKPIDPQPWIEAGRMLVEIGEQQQADAAYAHAAKLGEGELDRFLQGGWWVAGPYPEQIDLPCPPEFAADPAKPVVAMRAGRAT